MSYDEKCGQLRCDYCGKFVGVKDWVSREAIHVMAEPDSHYSHETYKTVCRECMHKEQKPRT